MFFLWYARHLPVAFVFKSLDSTLQIRRQHPAITSIEQYWQDKWFAQLIVVGNWRLCFFHSITSLVVTEYACASLTFTSFIDVPSLLRVDHKYLNWSTSSAFYSSTLWCCWRGFCLWWFSYRIQQLFSPVFQWTVWVLLHCHPADRCRQQTASCKAVALWFTLTTIGCQFLLHHMQSSRSVMDAKVSESILHYLFFRNIPKIVLEVMDILPVLLLSSERNLQYFHLVPLHQSLHLTYYLLVAYDIRQLAVNVVFF